MVKESCGWRVEIVTKVVSKMIGMRDSARTIVLMGGIDKEYTFKAKFKVKEGLHIRMAAFKWECLLKMNLREKSFWKNLMGLGIDNILHREIKKVKINSLNELVIKETYLSS
jgi:hypothetical protein